MRRGIQSIEIGASILKVIARAGGPVQLRQISLATGMSPSKIYRYLVSFGETGLVKQDPASGRYDLGAFCMELGLAALGRIDEFGVVSEALTRVTQETKRDVHVTIWTPAGPLIARWKQGPTDISIRVREGATLPLLMSATGRVWAHHLPREQVKALIDGELDAIKTSGKKKLRETLEQRVAAVGRHGLARSEEEMRPGIDALSGPIFNRDGMAFAMTVLSPHGSTDLSYEGAVARSFRGILQELSRQLGGRV